MLFKVFCDLCAVTDFTGNLPIKNNLIRHSSPFDFLPEQTMVLRSVAGPVAGPSISPFSRCEKTAKFVGLMMKHRIHVLLSRLPLDLNSYLT